MLVGVALAQNLDRWAPALLHLAPGVRHPAPGTLHLPPLHPALAFALALAPALVVAPA